MSTDALTHDSVARLVEAGAIRAAHVIGQKGGWGLLFKYGMTERPLAAQRGNVRVFKRFETIVDYLRQMGIMHFEVDTAEYDPAAALSEKARSKAERARVQMQATHSAAAHDKWFRTELSQALQEADDPATVWVSHDDAMSRLDAALSKHTKPARKGSA